MTIAATTIAVTTAVVLAPTAVPNRRLSGSIDLASVPISCVRAWAKRFQVSASSAASSGAAGKRYSIGMTKNPFPGLHRELRPHRAETAMVDGELVPGSVPILLSMLDAESDPHKRRVLYLYIVSECSIADRTAAAVKYAAAHFLEFGDVTALIGYAGALVANEEFEEGLERARAAVALAIEQQALINFAAGQYVRDAIKTGSVEAVNEALAVLADSTQKPRTEDCRFETDWVDAAEALGADAEMIAWVREVEAARSRR